MRVEPPGLDIPWGSNVVADPPEVLERFRENLKLVDMMARQIARTLGSRCGVELDDLISAGRVGLHDAARRFDAERGASFRHYAGFRVRGAIFDAVREMAAVPHHDYHRVKALAAADAFNEGDWHQLHAGALVPATMSARSADSSLDEHIQAMVDAAALSLIADGSGEVTDSGTAVSRDNPEEAYGRAEQLARIQQELDSMVGDNLISPSEREIIHRYYFDEQPITQIAKELNLAKSWVSEQHTRAITKLSERLRELDLP